jgi:hypothetical protein
VDGCNRVYVGDLSVHCYCDSIGHSYRRGLDRTWRWTHPLHIFLPLFLRHPGPRYIVPSFAIRTLINDATITCKYIDSHFVHQGVQNVQDITGYHAGVAALLYSPSVLACTVVVLPCEV